MSTFIDALASDYISIPRLTPALVRKYPPLSCGTAFGHLDTLRQGIASTRRSPSPHALGAYSFGSSSTRQSRCRFAFLKDCDDLERLESPALPVSLRLSVRLASTPSSPDTKVSTLHRSEWTAADLTSRFPIPSYKGHEYILVTKHLGFIHLLPMKTTSAPSSYVSALKKVLLFFSSESLPISHLILDNETSAILTAFLVSENVSFQHVPPFQHRTNPA